MTTSTYTDLSTISVAAKIAQWVKEEHRAAVLDGIAAAQGTALDELRRRPIADPPGIYPGNRHERRRQAAQQRKRA